MSNSAGTVRPTSELLMSWVGPAIWAAHFFVMYGSEALICTRVAPGVRDALFATVAISATALAVAGLVAFVVRRHAGTGSGARAGHGADDLAFSRWLSIGLALLSVLAVIWVALPALLAAPCQPYSG
jgi:hypothetical protein